MSNSTFLLRAHERTSHQPKAQPNDRANNRLQDRTAKVHVPTGCTTEGPNLHRQHDRMSEQPTDFTPSHNRQYSRTTEPGIDYSTDRLSHQPTGRPNDPATNRRYGRTSEPTTDCVTVQPSNKPTAPSNDRVNLDNKAKRLSRQPTDFTTELTSHQPTEQPNDPRIDCSTERPSQ